MSADSTIPVMAAPSTGRPTWRLPNLRSHLLEMGFARRQIWFLGYPLSDETPAGDHGGRYNDFSGGSIY